MQIVIELLITTPRVSRPQKALKPTETRGTNLLVRGLSQSHIGEENGSENFDDQYDQMEHL